MKIQKKRRFSRLSALLLAAALLVSALPMAAQAAVPSGGLSGDYFLSGNPTFAYVITSMGSAAKGTVKLYQNDLMQSYEGYTGDYAIPERVFNPDDMCSYTVTEIGGAHGTAPGALENVPLKSISLPGTVTTIGFRAFGGCTQLEEVVLPTSVTQLSEGAFYGANPQKLTLYAAADALLVNNASYTPKGRAIPVDLPIQITDLLVTAPLTVTGSATIPGSTTLSGGRITIQPGASLTLEGSLSGAGMIEVMNSGSLTLSPSASAAAYTGTIRLSGAVSTIVNGTTSPVTVVDASGKTIVVQPGDSRTGGQKETPTGGSAASRPQVTNNYGGSVSVQDEGKTVVVTPFQGYHVEEVVINGLSMGGITRYEFQAASSQNTVAVTFAQGKAPEGPDDPSLPPVFQFTDVSPAAPYAEAVTFLVNNGIFQGVGKNTFAPNQAATRAMVASLLKRLEVYGRAFQLPCETPLYTGDTPDGKWFTESAAWAMGTGVVPDETGGFFPNRAVTRQELALCLYRYTHARGYDTPFDAARYYAYTDIDSLSPMAEQAVIWAATNGYIPSKNGKVDPKAIVTRGEIAVTLSRYLQAY